MRAIVVMSMLLGCTSTSTCKQGTVFIHVTYQGATANADNVTIIATVDGGGPVTTMLQHKSGDGGGTIEVQFSLGYPRGHMFAVQIQAFAGGQLVGSGTASVELTGGCEPLSVDITTASGDAAVVDLVGVDSVGDAALEGGVDAQADLLVVKMQGDACQAGDVCATGHCVDGHCCDKACGNQCEACDVQGSVGACTTVAQGPPHGSRPACTNPGTTCGGSCTTASSTSCTYAPATTVCGAACDGTCDGNGTCSSSGGGACPNGFACGASSCLTSCTGPADCQPNFQCVTPNCVRVAESDCLDGIDNNGDGLADCQDPTCTNVQCVPAIPGGDQLGLLEPTPCPLNFANPVVLHNDLDAQACTGCDCDPSSTCGTDVYFSNSTCTSSTTVQGTKVGTLYSGTPYAGMENCFTVSQQNPASVSFATPVLVAQSCTKTGTPSVPTASWNTTVNFCVAQRTSSTCTGGQVCVAKAETGNALCLRVPQENATCPAGYTGGSAVNWYTDFNDNRTCSDCSCAKTADGGCNLFAEEVYYDSPSMCLPATLNPLLQLGGGDSCHNWGSGTIGALDWDAPSEGIPICQLNYTSSGSATPINGSTLCCPTCVCSGAAPCASILCPSGDYCDGTACQACTTAKFCSASCADCTSMGGDTCAGGTTCKCGSGAACTGRSDTCTTGVCGCGSGPSCSATLSSACVSGVCKCGSGPACDSKNSNKCQSGSCRCGTGPACTGRTDTCVSGFCKCGSGPLCPLGQTCTNGTCS